MNYQINLGDWGAVFAVPASLVDQHMKLAGAAQLKALLWLLRHCTAENSLETIAGGIGLSTGDTADALQYWVACGLLSSQGDLLYPSDVKPTASDIRKNSGQAPVPPIHMPAKPKDTSISNQTADLPTQKTTFLASSTPKPNSAEVTKRQAESSEISFLLNEAQVRLGKLISPGDCATLIHLHDWAGLPVSVILMVIEYATSLEKTNMRYIEKVAVSWANDEIDTLEKAEQKLQEMHAQKNTWNKVRNTLGLSSRMPSQRESDFSMKWVDEYKMPLDLIRLAYDECVDNTGKISFAYMNKILERWFDAGVKNKNDTENLRKKTDTKKMKLKAAKEPSFDLDKYDQDTNVNLQKYNAN